MIHKHQIVALLEYGKFTNVCAGFLLNLRNEESGNEITYYQNICDFVRMTSEINKKSFNEKDLLKYNPIEIIGKKKRVNYYWDINKFLSELK